MTAPPWVERTWSQIFGALDPLIHTARDAAAVRSTQLSRESGPPNQRKISFGRIGWNKAGCNKWTHAEDGRLLSGGHAAFLNCEVWAPSWSVCEREGLGPDVFFSVSSESTDSSKASGTLNFNSACILAVASELGQPHEVSKTADSFASVVQAVIRAHCVRQWGHVRDGAHHLNAINDLVVAGLFKPGPRHQAPLSLLSLVGTWTSF
jgi:hypothetical protein